MKFNSGQRWIAPMVAIFLISISLRVGVALYLGDSTPSGKDETSYSVLASRVADGFGFSFPEPWYPFAPADTPTAHWSFIYTAYIAGIYAGFGDHPLVARLIGAFLGGILLPWMVFRLAKAVIPEKLEIALLSAGMAAIYAYFVLFSAQLMTETFFIIAVLLSLERSITLERVLRDGKKPSIILIVGLGVSLGLATLLRQSILPWVIVLFVWLFIVGIKYDHNRESVLSLLGVGLLIILSILPFTVRNYRVYNDFLLLNSNSGYALYSAQHPLHGTNFQAFQAAPLPQDLDIYPEDEAAWDRELLGRGVGFIIQDPGRYVLLSVSRIADYFMFWPSSETTLINNIGRVISFALFLPFMVLGLFLSRNDWRRFSLLYLFMAFYSLLHILTWSMIRYRLPVDAVLLIFAAIGVLAVVKWFRHQSHTESAVQTNR